MQMFSKKSLFINSAIFAGSMILMLLLGEFVVRVLYKDEIPLFPRYHTDYHYNGFMIRGLRPNSEFVHTSVDGSWKIATNSQGFRNKSDFEYNKPKGVLRILALGDSHTEGIEARQDFTFSSVMERYLANKGYNVQVLNSGVSGFSTAEELIFLENEGIKYSPDVVVLGFFANDFIDNVRTGFFDLDGPVSLVLKKHAYLPGIAIQNAIYRIPFVKNLSEHSYFYSLLFNKTWEYFKGLQINKAGKSTDFEYAISTQNDYSDYQLDLALALILRMNSFCERGGIKLIIMDIPRRSAQYHYEPSLSKSFVQRIRNHGGTVITSDEILGNYKGTAEFHVPHGQHHISEFTHMLIGMQAGKWIGTVTPP